MKRIAAVACALFVAALSAPAVAQEEAEASESLSVSSEGVASEGSASGGGWMDEYKPEAMTAELGGFFGLLFMSDDHNLRDPENEHITINKPAFELGLRGGFFPLSFLGAEVEGAYAPAARAGERHENAKLWAVRGHVVGQLPMSRIVPFLVLGGGRLGVSSDTLGSDSDPSFHAGIGVKAAVNRYLDVRLDLRDNLTTKNPDVRSSSGELAQHPEVLIGLSVVLGRSAPKVAAVVERPVVAASDRDGDGFLDPDDKCPDEKGIAPDGCPDKDADKDGVLIPDDKCPDEKGVAPDGCPDKDADKDGFLIPDDKCPDVKGVAPDGCPDEDPDKDGIVGAADKCPNEPETKNGFQDEDGCPDEVPAEVKKFTGVIQGIEFDLNKATIRKNSYATLDAAAKVLTDYPDLRIEISGHTDNTGTHEHNMKLSQDRADSVKAYLVKKGIADDRITTRGAGPDEPIAENTTKENKQKNRRIEFKLLQK